jgi:hypothetical protein
MIDPMQLMRQIKENEMAHVVGVSASNIQHACSAARKSLGIKFKDSREVLRSGGEDGLWRVHLADGTIVETTIVHHSRAVVHDIQSN